MPSSKIYQDSKLIEAWIVHLIYMVFNLGINLQANLNDGVLVRQLFFRQDE